MSGLNERVTDKVVETRASVVGLLEMVQDGAGQLVRSVRWEYEERMEDVSLSMALARLLILRIPGDKAVAPHSGRPRPVHKTRERPPWPHRTSS